MDARRVRAVVDGFTHYGGLMLRALHRPCETQRRYTDHHIAGDFPPADLRDDARHDGRDTL